jgi:hypothetical protein
LTHGDAAFDEKTTDLIDDGRALTDKARADAVERKEIALGVLISTKCMVGRWTASAVASASR